LGKLPRVFHLRYVRHFTLATITSLLATACADDPAADENESESETAGDGDALTCEVEMWVEARVACTPPIDSHPELGEGVCVFGPDLVDDVTAELVATNADLFDWAVEPLPGEEVALVGEAYNVQRSGWSDGAYKSSINLLNTKYGMSLPGL
jgi:hypothetical protein